MPWRFPVLSGGVFLVSTLFALMIQRIGDPDFLGVDPYMTGVFLLASFLAGAWYAWRIEGNPAAGRPPSGIAWSGLFSFLLELMLVVCLASLLSLFTRRDVGFALTGLIVLIPIVLAYHWVWMPLQVLLDVIIVSLLMKRSMHSSSRSF